LVSTDTASTRQSNSTPGARHADVAETLQNLEAWGRPREWSGSDPYDGLNATRLAWPLTRSALGRRLLTQLVKRSPLNLRPVLGIPPGRSAAALGQLASSYALGAIPGPEGRARLSGILQVLLSARCPDFEEPCWGYHFDVQTRVFFYPAGSPNTIATAFAALGLLDAFEATHEPQLLDIATGTGEFFLRHIPQTEDDGGAFFGYLVGDRTPIHNANTLACAVLARLAHHTARDDMRMAAEAGLRWTIKHQRPDGSWPYGEASHLNWIDNFHTGYVLDSLMYSADAGLVIDNNCALENGLDYYRRALFLHDGTPKYTPASIYPIDAQCVAQAIQTMALAGERDPVFLDSAWRIFDFALRRMLRSNGTFLFQRRAHWTNATPHIRWVNAPMMQAFTVLQRSTEAPVENLD
jgi:polysaccharide biosynthesis protein VpsJ